MKTCPFCDLSHELILGEGRHAAVILSNPRLVAGHLLVVPKRHVEKPWELEDKEIFEIYGMIRKFQQKIVEQIAPGCDVRQNYRPFIKQGRIKIDHIHFHLIPRLLNDELYEKAQRFEVDLFKEVSEQEAVSISNLLKT